jgi:hypothetical protein
MESSASDIREILDGQCRFNRAYPLGDSIWTVQWIGRFGELFNLVRRILIQRSKSRDTDLS